MAEFSFGSINWMLILPIIVIQVVLMIIALTDLIRSGHTNGPRLLWIFIIVFVNVIGPILYFIFGRRNS